MKTNYAVIAALATVLAAPAAAQTPPSASDIARGVSRDVSRSVGRDVRDAMRAFSDHFYQERQGPEQTETITKAFKVGKTGTLDLANFSGDVTVTGGAGEEIKIDAVKRVRARTPEDAKAGLAAIQVNMTEGPGRVDVRTDYARRDIRGGVDYTIAVPSGATVYVKTMSGDVKVTGVKGETRAETVSGDVTVTGAGALVRAKTMSGDVTVGDISGEGELAFSSISGDVIAKNIKAKSLEISTTSGDLNLIDVTSNRVSASTMSGNVEFMGPLAKGGRYELRSHSGDVRLTPTHTTGFEVDANTFNGTFRSDFPVTLRSVGPASPPLPPKPPKPPTPPTPPGTVTPPAPPTPPTPPPPPDQGGRTTGERTRDGRRMPMGRSVTGTYGDGSAVLALVSFSGNITIVKK